MAEPVKSRRYDSPQRQAQAAATRAQILDAAQRLFEQHGYVGTSMAAIAAEAGVALKTVYIAFEGKRGLLLALWHVLLRGDEEPVPVGERPWFRAALEEPDPKRQLRVNAQNARRVKERAGRVLKIIKGAAAADPELAELWGRIQSDFHANQRAIVDVLAARGALAPGLDAARAADVLWTLNHPEVWWLLVDERGWTPAQYEDWLADALCAQLLA
jgi:AcrR family transcriptional regulator